MNRPRTLVVRLFILQFVLVLGLLLILGYVLDRVLEQRAVDALSDSLAQQGRALQAALSADPAILQAQVEEAGALGDARITVIALDGAVLADSWAEPATMENHAGRPEVRDALGGEVGRDQRLSETTGERFLYVAVPADGDRVVRTAVTLADVARRQRTIRAVLLAGFLLAAVVAALAALAVARAVARPLRRVSDAVEAMGQVDLSARAPEEGPEEVAALAAALNQMADRVEREVGASADARSVRDLVLSTMREGIVLFAADGAVSFSNAALASHLGNAPRSADALRPEELRGAVAEATRGETRQVAVDVGVPPRFLQGLASPVEGGGALLVIRDVTQERRLDAVRRDFVANASHELKTPAATIQATAETLRVAAEDDPAAIPRFAERLEAEALRLSGIVSDLLDLSRLESGPGHEERLPLDAVVRQEVDRARAEAERSGVRLEVHTEPVAVRGSRDDLSLLVRNLTVNAVNYTREGGSVDVRLARADGDATLTVRDTGIGIPQRDLDRIFERFYRVDRARSRETGGTGLGLSIVRHVAENHGGSVSVDSELGRGSTFTVRLPALD